MDDLSGRTGVITGGASGIGLATARLLAEEGMQLVLADIEEGPLERAAAELGALGVVCDVGDLASVRNLADQAYDRFGAVHLLFNNAGVAVAGPVVQMRHADWEWLVRVNLWGPIHGVEAFLERMIAQRSGGHILFTASFAGLVPNVGLGPYCVTKYGTVALAEVLQKELRAHGIGVSVLCPMAVATRILESERSRPAALRNATPTRAEGVTLIGGRLTPEQVAEMVLAAVRRNQLYVITHPEGRDPLRRRFARMDRAIEELHP